MMRVGGNSPASSMFSGRDASGAAGADSGSAAFAPRTLAIASVLALSYYGAVQVGLAFTFEPNAVSILWPPNAILLAALLLTPPRTWWLLIAAVFPAHLAAELSLGVPLTMTVCWFVSNVSEALLGAVLMVRYLGGAPRFDRVRDLSVFLMVGVVLAPVASSFLDAGFVALVGWRYGGEYWPVWRMRLFSNALATLMLVPLVVIWVQRGIKPLRQAALAEYAEVAALLTGVCVTSAIVFHQSHAPGESAMFMYAPLPFLMWAAVRRGVSGVSLCVAIVATLAITGVLRDRGPFTYGEYERAALAVQVFLIIAASSLMLLAASLAELRHARAAALRQKESLNLALGAAQMGTWDWDIARDRIMWRPAQEGSENVATTGPTESMDGLLGRVHADDRAVVRRAVNDAIERGVSGEVECRFLRGDGGLRWITSRGKVLLDARGKPQRMIGVHIDTTQRKSQEMQARAQREQLAHLSRVSILGELSGALAHELNQPLAAILINAQAALLEIEGPAPDLREIGEILTDIVADDNRAAEVIRRLRALFVRGAVQMQRVDANACIREVLVLEHSYLIARNVAIEVRLAAGIPAVMADHVQLQQVLLNLIVNACDAMAVNEPDNRRLRIVSGSNADGEVEIEISDIGVGIEDLEKIFEPFFSTKDHGVGLGLSICRTIIAAHRGRLWASNNATRGATLHVSMPTASEGSFELSGTNSGGMSAQ